MLQEKSWEGVCVCVSVCMCVCVQNEFIAKIGEKSGESESVSFFACNFTPMCSISEEHIFTFV